jgi:hypothetical protein
MTGLATGVVGAFVHPAVVVGAGIAWPIGLPLALGLFGVALALANRAEGPAGAWACSSGWVLAVLVLSWPRAAGDIVIAGAWFGYAFLGLGFVLGLGPLVAAWWRRTAVPTSAGAVSGR